MAVSTSVRGGGYIKAGDAAFFEASGWPFSCSLRLWVKLRKSTFSRENSLGKSIHSKLFINLVWISAMAGSSSSVVDMAPPTAVAPERRLPPDQSHTRRTGQEIRAANVPAVGPRLGRAG
ncbi:hypothetical protein BS50DRAFT_251825 [Corynespora cassiicola Philippines]|uniref:Uncharacterized protein n=1 Tax=Corynespora cassiicola Philippines TaxID=1448308 RepID=A0A2T2P437_CORCC|nr:hypothetical protein BS50DRAFT_251825 [Corynespora cassiicola Philippines]